MGHRQLAVVGESDNHGLLAERRRGAVVLIKTVEQRG
jgi:hypothetical protein